MSNLTRVLMMGAAGVVSGPTYVDDVFSTYLYEGNASGQGANAQSIVNNIDLSGEGGLTWIKRRDTGGSSAWSHYLFDTERGATKYIRSNENDTEATSNNSLSAFNSDGFTLGESGGTNANGGDFVSWTFRKAPGFFDVVTWAGSNGNRNISHNLASVPGCIILKRTDTAESKEWIVYHRSAGTDGSGSQKFLKLNSDADSFGDSGILPSSPTSTQFSVSSDFNASDGTYVAYIFAHDEPVFGTDADESIIKCGGFTGANYTESLGFEPQWLLAKRTDNTSDWFLVDNMRGFLDKSLDSVNLRPNTDDDENTAWFHLTSDGFYYSSSSAPYIYIAIRRPNKPPESATEVYKSLEDTDGTATATGFTVDMALSALQSGTSNNHAVIDRFRDRKWLSTSINNPNSVGNFNANAWATNDGMNPRALWGSALYHFFKRAPGFFDMVQYDGNATAGKTVTHNLESVPEFIICKCKNDTAGWWCYHKDLTTNYAIRMDGSSNGSVAEQSVSNYWNSSTHSSTTFTLGSYADLNGTNKTFTSYLFATLPGISKVGSYSGTGNAVDVDCGFTAGARFVMIKRKNGSGDWYVWNTATGIVSGDDPYLLLNTDAAEVTNTDYIDPLSSGFTVTSSAPAALNTNGGDYIFLAIA